MGKSQFDDDEQTGPLNFVEKLQDDHYNVIKRLCENAKKQISELRELENTPASQYIISCGKLIDEIKDQIKQREEIFIPYLTELLEKDAEKHDCSTCTGTGPCSLKHELQLVELTGLHHKIKSILYFLQMAALPLHSETLYPGSYRVLRNHMALLEDGITGLFLIESTVLIPKIKEAQKNINAHG